MASQLQTTPASGADKFSDRYLDIDVSARPGGGMTAPLPCRGLHRNYVWFDVDKAIIMQAASGTGSVAGREPSAASGLIKSCASAGADPCDGDNIGELREDEIVWGDMIDHADQLNNVGVQDSSSKIVSRYNIEPVMPQPPVPEYNLHDFDNLQGIEDLKQFNDLHGFDHHRPQQSPSSIIALQYNMDDFDVDPHLDMVDPCLDQLQDIAAHAASYNSSSLSNMLAGTCAFGGSPPTTGTDSFGFDRTGAGRYILHTSGRLNGFGICRFRNEVWKQTGFLIDN